MSLGSSLPAIEESAGKTFVVRPLLDEGRGLEGLPDMWQEMVYHSAKLSSPQAMGHMDTAPHPVAALTDALVSSLNNNLLFREISPLASVIEEQLIEEFAAMLSLPQSCPGIWTSGGSLANLTALFAAAGGYNERDAPLRHKVKIIAGERGHASVAKAARILGVPMATVPPLDVNVGCVNVGKVEEAVVRAKAQEGITHPVVVATLGGTVNGHVDNVALLGEVCARHGAWFHVDAIWGGALMYSADPASRAHLNGLEHANSVSLGPQKWLFAPRLCALTLFPKLLTSDEFDATLAAAMPYSARSSGGGGSADGGGCVGDDDGDGSSFERMLPNRSWGLQGSRRADCLPLWATLQVLGRDGVRSYVDKSMSLTRDVHDHLLALGAEQQQHAGQTSSSSGHVKLEPTHTPQLNLLTIRANKGEKDLALRLQRKLMNRGEAWVSVAPVGNEYLMRCVLANPELELSHCKAMLASLAEP
jgi:glutamate/tyrosine decarboxylase-like PLP-dependent enzyme